MSIDDALRFLDRAAATIDGPALRDGLLYAGRAAGVKMEEIAGEYPEPSGKPLAVFYDRTGVDGRQFKSKFKSLRQQRKVFALIKAGKVPYRRSGRLGASLTSDAEIVPTGMVIKVGTNTPYARYVIGSEEEQSHYHRGTWEPLQRKIDDNAAEVIEVFSRTLMNYLRGYLKGK